MDNSILVKYNIEKGNVSSIALQKQLFELNSSILSLTT